MKISKIMVDNESPNKMLSDGHDVDTVIDGLEMGYDGQKLDEDKISDTPKGKSTIKEKAIKMGAGVINDFKGAGRDIGGAAAKGAINMGTKAIKSRFGIEDEPKSDKDTLKDFGHGAVKAGKFIKDLVVRHPKAAGVTGGIIATKIIADKLKKKRRQKLRDKLRDLED